MSFILIGFLALLAIGGMIWCLKEGAPIIGFIILCAVVGFGVVLLL